ncbi:MAG: hypothetical protein WDW38_007801 [Sanguina aurantia]
MDREELIDRLEERSREAHAVELDSSLVRTIVERLRDGLDLQRQLEQVQDQLTLKPSVAKKLNSKITGLEAELAVLRGSKKVDSMEKKILKLEAELKQSYSTKNFTVKSGLLDIEKAYRDFIDSHKDVQALWGEIMLLTVEDKDGLPTGTVSQRRAAMNSAEQAAVERPPPRGRPLWDPCTRPAQLIGQPPAEAHTVRTPGGGRSSASTHGDGVSHGEELPPLAADDGDGSGGGGALHLHASSYVQSQVCRFKDGSAPNSADPSGNRTPSNSVQTPPPPAAGTAPWRFTPPNPTRLTHTLLAALPTPPQEASAPSSANLSGNSTPLRSTSSAYATRLDGRGTCADSAQQEPDFPHPQAEAPHHPSLGERGGVSGITAAHAAVGGAEVALSPAGPAAAAAAAVQMLRPHSLLTAAGRVDASALEQHASHFLLSISQLKELYRGFGYHPGMPASPGAATAASSVSSSTGSSSSRPITPSPPDASEVDSQVESLIVSVEQMRALFSQAGSSAPKPAAPGHIPSHDHHTCSVTPDASGYSTQAEAALQSIQHLREMFRQAQAAHTSGGGSSSSTAPDGDDGRVPDARYFDKQSKSNRLFGASPALVVRSAPDPDASPLSAQQCDTEGGMSVGVEDHTTLLVTLLVTQQLQFPVMHVDDYQPAQACGACAEVCGDSNTTPDHTAAQQHQGPLDARSHSSDGPSPPAGTHQNTNPPHAQHHSSKLPQQELRLDLKAVLEFPQAAPAAAAARPAASTQPPPSIEQLLHLFSCYLATQALRLQPTNRPAPANGSPQVGRPSPQAGGGGADAASPAVDVAGAVALLLQLPSDAALPCCPRLLEQLPVPPGPLPAGPSDAVHHVAVDANGGVDAVGDSCTSGGSSSSDSGGGGGGGGHAHVAQCGSSPGLDHGRGPPGSLATSTAGGAIDPSSPDATHGVRLPPHAAPHAPESFAHTPHQNQQPAPHHPTVSATAPNTPHRPLQSEAQGLGVQALLGQLRVKHASLLAASPGAETLLQDALQLLSLAQPHPPTADGPLPATQPPTHPSAAHVSTHGRGPSQAQHSQRAQQGWHDTHLRVAHTVSETQGGGAPRCRGVSGMPPHPRTSAQPPGTRLSLPRVHAPPHLPSRPSKGQHTTPPPETAGLQGHTPSCPRPAHPPPRRHRCSAAGRHHSAHRQQQQQRKQRAARGCLSGWQHMGGGASRVISGRWAGAGPDGGTPPTPVTPAPADPAAKHAVWSTDAIQQRPLGCCSSSGPVTLSEITPVQEEDPRGNGPPAARVSLEGHRPGTAAAAAAPDTLPASKEASDGGPEDGSTPGTPTHASAAAGGGSSSGGGIGAEVITPPSASVSAAAAAAAAGGQTAEASRPSFPESLAAAYQLAGMTPPTAGASSAPAARPPSGVPGDARPPGSDGRRRAAAVTLMSHRCSGVVVDDDLASGETRWGLGGALALGLSHLREAKATLTEKVIAYEALILRLSEQMRVAVEAGDDAGGRVAALTSEVDTLARERGVLDRRLQDCQEESTTVTSELIVRKMSLAQLTGGWQAREAAGQRVSEPAEDRTHCDNTGQRSHPLPQHRPKIAPTATTPAEDRTH